MSDLPTGTRQLTDSAGAVADSYLYTAYGEPVASTGADRNPFQYGGQVGYYTGPGAGIILCGARWYNPYTARWMTRDPIGYAGGADLYAYCGESPVVGLDPDGLNCGGGYWLGTESTPPPGGDGLSGWDFCPFLGPGRDIYYGVENGDPLRFGLGLVGMACDIASLGGDFAERGAIEGGAREALTAARTWAPLGIFGGPYEGVVHSLVSKGYDLRNVRQISREEQIGSVLRDVDEIHINLRGTTAAGLEDERYFTTREWQTIQRNGHAGKTTVYNPPAGLEVPPGMTVGRL